MHPERMRYHADLKLGGSKAKKGPKYVTSQ